MVRDVCVAGWAGAFCGSVASDVLPSFVTFCCYFVKLKMSVKIWKIENRRFKKVLSCCVFRPLDI